MKYKNTFEQEFGAPLYEIERPYLRKPFTVIMAIFFPFAFIVIWTFIGIIKVFPEWYYLVKASWCGTPHDRPIF